MCVCVCVCVCVYIHTYGTYIAYVNVGAYVNMPICNSF